VRRDPVPTVLPWMWSHYRGFPAVTAVFLPSPLPCRPLSHSHCMFMKYLLLQCAIW